MADQIAAPPDPSSAARHRLLAALPAPPTSFTVLQRHRGVRSIPLGTVTTYHYRTSGGAFGSTTDAGAIPAGAVVVSRTSA